MSADDVLQRGHDLMQLRFHWGEAYEIGYDSGSFWFRRRDNGAELRCSTATALWGEIRRDYSAMPVPRDAVQTGALPGSGSSAGHAR